MPLPPAFPTLVGCLALLLGAVAFAQEPAGNHVLELDGEDDYVALRDKVFEELAEVTVEGWVKWRNFTHHARVIDITISTGRFALQLRRDRPRLLLESWEGNERRAVTTPEILPRDEWVHVAATGTSRSDSRFCRLMGSNLTVASVKGPTFSVTLPAVVRERTGSASPEPSRPAAVPSQ